MNKVLKTIKKDINYTGAMVICIYCKYQTLSNYCELEKKPIKYIFKHCKKAIKKRRKYVK